MNDPPAMTGAATTSTTTTIRRTRTDLKIHDQYKLDLEEQGIIFPDIKKPNKVFYQLSEEAENLYDETMHLLSHDIDGIKY